MLCAVLATACCPGVMAAQPGEYEVKAAFIHNIAKFVEWPAASATPGSARLCLHGRDTSGGAMDVLHGKSIGRIRWEVVPVNSSSSLSECRVLFIFASEGGNIGRILERIGNHPVLTMGDSAGYAEQGVMVNFFLEERKVRFEINREAATRAGLGISSQLLRMARIVPGSGG